MTLLTPGTADAPGASRRPGGRWKQLVPSRGRVALLAGLAGCVILVLGWIPRPTGSAVGGALPGPTACLPPGKTTFRAAIFNMHSGIGTDETRDLARTAEALRDTDFCALNEVRGRLLGQSRDQAHDLAGLTNRACLYMPTERRFWHDDFGNAILTRLPVVEWARIPLPSDGAANGYRNVTWGRVDLGGHTVNVVITHINPLTIQPAQIRMVADLFCSLREPALLLADFNADFKQPQVKALLETPGVHDCLAETVGRKSGRVDWILSRGMKTVNGGRIDNGASDHSLFWVDLEPSP